METTNHCQSYLLRLPKSLREEAFALARQEGVSLNHFISLAVTERITRMERRREMASLPPELERRSPAIPMRPGVPVRPAPLLSRSLGVRDAVR